MAINLLPSELVPKGPYLKLSNVFRKIGFIGLGIFIVSTVVTFALFFYLSSEAKSSAARQQKLKDDIKSLEATEQRLILLRDRIAKAKQVLELESAVEEVKSLAVLQSSMPSGVSLLDANLTQAATETTILADNSSSLSQFLATLISKGEFSQIHLKSFNFARDRGYRVSFELRGI